MSREIEQTRNEIFRKIRSEGISTIRRNQSVNHVILDYHQLSSFNHRLINRFSDIYPRRQSHYDNNYSDDDSNIERNINRIYFNQNIYDDYSSDNGYHEDNVKKLLESGKIKDNKKEICPITKYPIKEKYVSKCNHHFEKLEIIRWVGMGNIECPVCRQKLWL